MDETYRLKKMKVQIKSISTAFEELEHHIHQEISEWEGKEDDTEFK